MDQSATPHVEPPPRPVDTETVPPPAAFGPKQAFAVIGVHFGGQVAVGFVVALVTVFAFAFRSGMGGRAIGPPSMPAFPLMVAFVASFTMGGGGAIGVSLIWRRGRLHSGAPTGFGLAQPAARTTLAGVAAAVALALASAATVTAIFVIGHVTEAMAYWPALLAIAGLGALTAGLRIWSGSILPGLAAHFAYNLVVVAAAVGF